MEVAVTSHSGQIVRQASFRNEVSASGSTDFTLRTKEGDLVSVFLDGRSAHSESGQENQFDDGAMVSEFSAAAQAASQFSLNVEGELSEEELAAIQVLVGRISPLAQNFFAAPDEFKTEEETSSLSGTFGVIEEIELKLERTVNVSIAVATHEVVHDQDNLPADPTAEIGSPTESNIRDVEGLVQAVVDSVFRAESTEFPGEDAILRSLGDLKQLLGDILKKALDPLHNPEIKEFPEDADFAVPADESSVITLEDTPRFQPVTV